jgi:hypothetical protein
VTKEPPPFDDTPGPLPSDVLPHHTTEEIVQTLAHVRVMERFFDRLDDAAAVSEASIDALRVVYEDVLADVLEPYAVDLAISLAALEDSLEPFAPETEAEAPKRRRIKVG